MLQLFIPILILILTFIITGIPIIFMKRRYEKSQQTPKNVQTAGASKTAYDSNDPNQFFISAWGWVKRQLSTDTSPVLASTCVFGANEVKCTFPGSSDVLNFKLDADISGSTVIVSGTTSSGGNVPNYNRYQVVSEGDIDDKCYYHIVPPTDDTTLGVPRRQLILGNNLTKLTYTPECIEPNIIDGQAHIRACMGTILFGSQYKPVPQCIDSKGIRREVNYVENYVASCAADDKITTCNSSSQLVYLSIPPNGDATLNVDDFPIYVSVLPALFAFPENEINPIIGVEGKVYFGTVSQDQFSLLISTYSGPPAELFEVGYFDNNLTSSIRGINMRFRHQGSDRYVLAISKTIPSFPPDPPVPPFLLTMPKVSDVANFGICWRSLDVISSQDQSVFTGNSNSYDPQWTLITAAKFKTSIERFHTTLLSLPPADWLTPITDNYTALVSAGKIYAEGQGLLEIISTIVEAFNTKQGSVDIPKIDNMYDAFQTLFYLYYNCSKVSGHPQLEIINFVFNLFNSEFIFVLSSTMIDPDATEPVNIKTLTNAAVLDLIQHLDNMISIVNDPRFTEIKNVLVKISQLPINTSLSALYYLVEIVDLIPRYSTTYQPTFADSWILFRTALVTTGTLLTSDKELYIKIRTPLIQYEQRILEFIVQVQGYADVISFIPSGLIYCEKIQNIPLIPSDIINWIAANQTENPVYRVYRSGATSFEIEQVNITELTYFGLTNLTGQPFVPTSSMKMSTLLGIRSKNDQHII